MELIKAIGMNKPLIGHLELTYKCTYKCGFFYNSKISKKEMCTDELLDIIDQFCEEGCFFLNLSGGEPLIHPDFDIIYQYLVERGVRLSIETNASYLPEKIIDLFKKYPPFKVLVLMHAISEPVYT